MPSLIGDALRWYGRYTPKKAAIISESGSVSYAELWQRAVRLADGLYKLGVGPGDRFAISLPNCNAYIELYQAAALLGAAVVPLNYRFIADEMAYILEHSGAKVVVHDAQCAPTVQAALNKFDHQHVQCVVVGPAPAGQKSLNYDALIDSSTATDWPASMANPAACYFQGYTSGTTGFPKGCVNPHREFADCLRRLRLIYSIGPDDRELVVAPLFHEAPALFALTQVLCGGTLIVTADAAPESVLKLIQASKPTWAFMVPTMWAALVNSGLVGQFDVSSLRTLISGGSALQTPTKDALIDAFPSAGLNEFYGATEVGLVSNLGPEDQKRKLRSVGRPVPGMLVDLRDEQGNAVPDGEIGEIYIGGSTIIREYYKNPEATAKSVGADGFFTLGDMGRFDDEGYLYIVDRKKDMIISGGENIYPNDIEDVLYQHPAVHMAAVVGAPDPRWGEVVVAVVSINPGQSANEDELLAYCKERLSHFKVPKRIEIRDALPLSAIGKILRRKVRDDFWENHTEKV